MISLLPPWNSGRYMVTGSIKRILPCSNSFMIGGSGGDHLGERREIEDGVVVMVSRVGTRRPLAVGLAMNDLAVVATSRTPPGIKPVATACCICASSAAEPEKGLLREARASPRANSSDRSFIQFLRDTLQQLARSTSFWVMPPRRASSGPP